MAKNEYKPVTAQDAIAPFGALSTDVENAEKAEAAGVYDAAYVDYETALKNYESRSDIETLEERLAREVGRSFPEASHVREVHDSAYVEGDALKAARKGADESAEFKRGQAKETTQVSDGRETAKVEPVEGDKK